jgi:hypothetical protein
MNIMSWQRLKYSLKYFPQILKSTLVILLVLQGINFFFNQIMIYLQEARMTSKEDFFVPIIIALAVIGFFVQSAIKVLWVLVICHYFYGKESLSGYLKERTEQGLIESLRAFLKSILFGFLFIIPGIIKMIRYQFVVFIVATEKKYQNGEIEALHASENLTQGRTLPLMILTIFFVGLSVVFTSNELLVEAPFSVLGMEALTLCLTTLESIYLYLLFTDLKKLKGIES